MRILAPLKDRLGIEESMGRAVDAIDIAEPGLLPILLLLPLDGCFLAGIRIGAGWKKDAVAVGDESVFDCRSLGLEAFDRDLGRRGLAWPAPLKDLTTK